MPVTICECSDDLGVQIAEDATICYDLRANVMHLLSIDHKRVTEDTGSIDRRLADFHATVIGEFPS